MMNLGEDMTDSDCLTPCPSKKCLLGVIGVSVVVYIALMWMVQWAGFNVICSDSAMYCRWSHGVWDFSYRSPTHLPLYAILLWGLRCVTFGLLTDQLLLPLAATLFAAGSYIYVYRILVRNWPNAFNIGFVLFGLYPFVGFIFTFDPRADTLAILCLTGAMLYSMDRKWGLFLLCLAGCIITHKAVWPFAALLSIDAVWRKKCPVYLPFLALVPLLLYWLWGLCEGQTLLWLVHDNLRLEIRSKSSLPILDGLLGTILHPKGAAKLFKGLVLLLLFSTSLYLAAWYLRRFREPQSLFCLAVVIPVLVLLAILNQYEIWAAVRFSRVIAVPLAVSLAASDRVRVFLERPVFFWGVAAFCILFNVLFCYYGMFYFQG
jgi:hypothetical protein